MLCSLLLWQTPASKANWGRKGLFHLTCYSPSVRDDRARTRSRKHREMLLAGLLPGFLQLPYLESSASPAYGWYCPWWTGLSWTNLQLRKHDTDTSRVQSMEEILQLRFLLPRYSKLTNKIRCHLHYEKMIGKNCWCRYLEIFELNKNLKLKILLLELSVGKWEKSSMSIKMRGMWKLYGNLLTCTWWFEWEYCLQIPMFACIVPS